MRGRIKPAGGGIREQGREGGGGRKGESVLATALLVNSEDGVAVVEVVVVEVVVLVMACGRYSVVGVVVVLELVLVVVVGVNGWDSLSPFPRLNLDPLRRAPGDVATVRTKLPRLGSTLNATGNASYSTSLSSMF